ncbi:MAG TPA: hypothetical protein VNM14_14490 [Planctomycetota bacterium]|jgi:hypothetical protein|nr:hypothetical protein [Planctomycetota bacterium]
MIYLLAILCLVVPQDTKTATRQEKTEYNAAVAKCKDGESMIDSDPQAAIERFSELIGNSKLRAIECMLRIEQRPAEYSEPYAFLPYQYRARARMNLAKKASPENAQKLIAGAIEDFQESEKRNVAPSAEMRKAAEGVLARLKADVTKPPDTVKADPVAKFKEKWDPLMVAKRFKSAKAVIDKDSEGLTEEQKKGFLESTEQKCRSGLISWVSEFRPRFLSAVSAGLDQKTADEFDELFALPAADELIVSNPPIDWLRKYLPTFREVQSQKLPPHGLIEAAVASVPLEDSGSNRWFQALEGVIFQSLKGAIAAEVQKAQNAAKADRDKARKQADALQAQWKGFSGKLDAKFLERHKFVQDHEGQLGRLFDGFPADLADLEKINLDSAFSAESPDAELSKIEAVLSNFESKGNLTLESRQRLYTLWVTVGALRGLFGGKTVDAVAADLSGFRQKLRDAGGPEGDVKKYGPRVEKVFAALR